MSLDFFFTERDYCGVREINGHLVIQGKLAEIYGRGG